MWWVSNWIIMFEMFKQRMRELFGYPPIGTPRKED